MKRLLAYTNDTLTSRTAREWAMRATVRSELDDIRNRRVRSSTERNNADDERQQTRGAHDEVLLGKWTARAEQAEPHNRRDPE